MYVKEIWRYPVKSMAGERLERARLTDSGIEGDRVVHVRDKAGRKVTSRTHPQLLGLHATLGADGEPLIDGLRWDDPATTARLRKIGGNGRSLAGVSLVRDDTTDRFDILPLLVATDGAIAEFGRDTRRLRPNIVIGGVAGMAERGWQGGQLSIGDVRVAIEDLRGRCIMTTFDPDTLAHDPEVLRDIVRRFGGKLALNCAVIRGGEIEVGQTVRVDGAA